MVRVSCSAFIRLTDGQGRFAALSHLRRTRRELSPIGGAIKCTRQGKRYLVHQLGVDAHGFRDNNDLRFSLEEEHLPAFEDWFSGGSGLEKDPARREFIEELGPKEYGILTSREAKKCRFELQYGTSEILIGRRRGKPTRTHCFYRFYTARVPEPVMRKLVEVSQPGDSLLGFLTRTEINTGWSIRGSRIAGVCRLMV